MAPQEWRLSHGAALFVQWLLGCGYRDASALSTYSPLRVFMRWCAEQGVVCIPDVERDLLRRFFQHLREKNLSGYTVKQYKSALTSLFAYFLKVGLIGHDPMALLHVKPNLPKSVQAVLSAEEIRCLLTTADKQWRDTPSHQRGLKRWALRDKVLLQLLVATGLRASEIVGLRICDLDLEDGILRVQGKGSNWFLKRDRKAFIDHPVLLRDLRLYLSDCPKDPEAPLFPNPQGKPLGAMQLSRIVHRLGRRADIRRRLFAHLFRHTFCSALIANGADVFSVQKLMGHWDVAITLKFYLHLTPNEVRSDWQTHNPLIREAKPC